ncbi:hypothetical protein Caci_6860 [Catenulispora acidiphila DSM 44928]|uniref:Uncharacterized protein n=1 Tax=Catenulispora acidiphila (strain DSM 44928 / JCM 14897 / NBRC 102108 / NRRL B-24433 / ID139908) TaxID=479433 RepID=C7Q3D5_CATAD|nr:hypothetical protein [Catenulispora acidiphila]ACU75700.1 hypothetical protein Caci_6860 [Catenulispora acidiphila DSM 44928]
MTDHPIERNPDDETILAYLAGDDAVVEAARGVWHQSKQYNAAAQALKSAKRDLQSATDSFSAAIRASRIPEKKARRLSAALMMRLGREWLLAEGDDPAHESSTHA